MSRSKATILAGVVLVITLFAWTGAVQAFPAPDLLRGLSAADWADISGQIGTQQLPDVPMVVSPAFLAPLLGVAGAQQAYLKASNPGWIDSFGYSVAISGDTVVVGAAGEDSSATGVGGNQSNDSATGSGAVYVFVRSGSTWNQEAYLKASNTGASDSFGYSVAISGDTVVVGAAGEDSSATGVNGGQGDNSASGSGAAYVFTRSGGIWTQEAYLKASNTGAGDKFGCAVAISGSTVVVGAWLEDSNATGVGGNQSNDSAMDSGAVYVFVRSGSTWNQEAYLKASNTGASDGFGYSVAISGDTVAVGATGEDSSATGVNGGQGDNSASDSGAAYVFNRSGTSWTQQAYLKGLNIGRGAYFGCSVAVSGDTAVVGAYSEEGGGAAYVYTRGGSTWAGRTRLEALQREVNDRFGCSVAISGDTILVGASSESSGATGVNGDPSDNSVPGSGAAYVFTFIGAGWFQTAYLKASNTGVSDIFGRAVAISDGTAVVAADGEDSSATGVNGDESSNDTLASGAVYVFTGVGETPDAPAITGLDPASGPGYGGTVIKITGTAFFGLSGAGAVTFGGHNALSYTVESDHEITATAPSHSPGAVQVRVTTVVGATPDTGADDYTYVDVPLSAHERVSLDSAEAQGNSDSGIPSANADGRLVAFESDASDLVPDDYNGVTDVFVRDRANGTTERVSVDINGFEANAASGDASISADGRFVAFLSSANYLVAGDVNTTGWDVLVHDRYGGINELVDVSSAEVQGNGTCLWTSISADGRYVCFASSSSNLVTGDSNGMPDIFVRDRTNGTTERVSVSSSEVQANNGSDFCSISADGRYVVFDSVASNLVSGDTNGKWDAFVRDRTAGTTQRVSVVGAGTQGNNDSGYPRISTDGRFVTFESYATNLVTGDSNGMADIFVRDRTAGTTARVSVSNGGMQGNGDSAFPSISADGRYVTFESYATNLVTGDTNALMDVFVRDRTEGTTRRVSVDASGVQGNDDSYWSSISGDGKYIAFGSAATNLVTDDTNGVEDVFAFATPNIPSYPSYRGSDRYDTAVRLSKAMFPGALPADSGLVLAPGETFQEALCGAPLAAAWGGPVLLTYQTALANNIKAELQRLLPSQVFCIGMAPAVITAVQDALPAATVTAINGAAGSVYDMSYKVAKALGDKVQAGGGDMIAATAIVTIGTNFPDAIGVSPLACAKLWPILLTNYGDDRSLNSSAAAALTELGITKALKVGTYVTLPGGVAGLANLSGGDRYYTCANVANWAKAYAGLSFQLTGLATGDKFPDALASGPYLARENGILLLSPLLGPLPAPIGAVLTVNRAAVQRFTYIACVEPVIGQVKALLP